MGIGTYQTTFLADLIEILGSTLVFVSSYRWLIPYLPSDLALFEEPVLFGKF